MHSHPNPGQRPVSMKAAKWTVWRETAPVIPFQNPDPVACLVGWSNETPVIVDGQRVTALINSGAQVSSINSGFCDLLALEVHPLGWLIVLEGKGGSIIPHLGYVEVNLQIPGIKVYNEDILMLVIPTTTYSEMVSVMIRSKIIDWVKGMMIKGELARATVTWRQAHFSAVMSGSLQLPHTTSKEDGEVRKEVTPSTSSDPAASRGFCLDDVWGTVHTIQKVTIPPFGTVSIHGHTGVWGHCMWVHMLAEPAWGPQLPASVVPTATYGELHPGSSRVPICLRNLSAHPIEVRAKAIVGQVTPANQVPPAVLPMEASGAFTHGPQKGWILEALNLQAPEEWPDAEQEQARKLLLRWKHLFAHSDLDLSKTSLLKHQI